MPKPGFFECERLKRRLLALYARRGILMLSWATAVALTAGVPSAYANYVAEPDAQAAAADPVNPADPADPTNSVDPANPANIDNPSDPANLAEEQTYGAILYDDGELYIYRETQNDVSNGQNQDNDQASGSGGGTGSETGNASSGAGSEGQDNANDGAHSGQTAHANNTANDPAASGSGENPANSNASQSGTATLMSYPTIVTPGNSGETGTSQRSETTLPQPPDRQVIAEYKTVMAKIDCPEHASWYGNRDKVLSVSFSEGVAPSNMAYWFAGLSNLSNIDFDGLSTARATSMRSLFDGCGSLETLDVSTFDTAKVTDMARLFAGCSSLKSVDVSKLNTANVECMDSMFEGCSSIRRVDLSALDTHNVKSTSNMLKGCSSLSAVDVSGFSVAQVSAMALPVENEGGFWQLNVPANFVTGIQLREPTQAERAEAGLQIDDDEAVDKGGGNPNYGNSGNESPDAGIGGNGGESSSNYGTENGGNGNEGAENISGAGSGNNDALSGVVSGNNGSAGTELATRAIKASEGARAARSENASAEDADTTLLGIISPVEVLLEEAAATAAGSASRTNESVFADLLRYAAYVKAIAVEVGLNVATASNSVENAAAVVGSIATSFDRNPMTPIGIPLSLFATTVLLAVVIPITLLTLRDRRL